MVGVEKGFFEGLEVKYRIIDDQPARYAAFEGGSIDIVAASVDEFALSAEHLKGKIFLVTDESYGADGVVAKPEIKTTGDLRGKKVAFARATPSHYLLFKVLERAGLTAYDIEQVQMQDPGGAGQAFLGGKVDAAVTWEPFLSQVRDSGKGHVLATSRDFPGTIVDVLVASPKLLAQTEVLKRFIRGWLRSVEYIKARPGESAHIMANGLGVKKEDAEGMMAGLRFADTARNKFFFSSSEPDNCPLAQVVRDAGEFWKRQGITSTLARPSDLISNILPDVPDLPGGGK
jgi:NitT/TauT family transport system substrate-binding protein